MIQTDFDCINWFKLILIDINWFKLILIDKLIQTDFDWHEQILTEKIWKITLSDSNGHELFITDMNELNWFELTYTDLNCSQLM